MPAVEVPVAAATPSPPRRQVPPVRVVAASIDVDSPQHPIGLFSRLRDLAAGEVMEVTDAAGRLRRYQVQSVTSYPKAALPSDRPFARSGTRGLVLIACGGQFDSRTGRYADNVVAIATPIT